MSDQAEALRAAAGVPAALPRLPALAVTGGKGGIGKTCLAVNLAVAFAQLGQRTMLVDLDLGLANADVLLGIDPPRGLAEVITQGLPLADVVVRHPSGVALVPAASGRDDLTTLSEDQHRRLFQSLATLADAQDVMILDTAAGIHRTVTAALQSAHLAVVVVTPDPTSLTDAYALIKVLERQAPGRDLRVLVNQSASLAEAQTVHQRLDGVTRQFLSRTLGFLGQIPRDRAVTDAVRARHPLLLHQPNSLAAQAIRQVAMKLKDERWK